MSRPGRRRGRVLAVVVVVLTVAFVGMAVAQELELRGKVRSGREVVVPAGETLTTDLYASGGRVRVDGAVEGDVVAAGGEVQITGRVGGDVVIAGGNLAVPGEVGGDVRAAGGQLAVDGSVGEDVLFAGGQIGVNGSVGEDLVFSAGQAALDGEVTGDVFGSAGAYARHGTVGGTEQVTVGEDEPPSTLAEQVFATVRRYGAVFIVGAVLVWLAPALLEGAAGRLRQRPLPSLGLGLLGMVGFVVGVVVAIVLAAVVAVVLGLLGLGSLVATTIFSAVLVVGALSFAFAVAVAFVADAVAGLTLGRLLSGGAGTPPRARQLGLMALGLVPVVVLTALPVVGPWVRPLVALLGLGALLLGARRAARSQPAAGVGPNVPEA